MAKHHRRALLVRFGFPWMLVAFGQYESYCSGDPVYSGRANSVCHSFVFMPHVQCTQVLLIDFYLSAAKFIIWTESPGDTRDASSYICAA